MERVIQETPGNAVKGCSKYMEMNPKGLEVNFWTDEDTFGCNASLFFCLMSVSNKISVKIKYFIKGT